MAASSLNSLTQAVCNTPSVFRAASSSAAAAATAPAAVLGGHRNTFPNLLKSCCTTRTPRPSLSSQKDVGLHLQYPAVVRTSGKALLAEEILLTHPIEVSQGLEELSIIQELVPRIRENLSCIRNSQGEISVSAYDTAWVARIPAVDGSGGPQFPGTLEWIATNQHPDGSWGDDQKEWLYDRYIQTLACIVALKSWDLYPDSLQRGIDYFKRFADRLEGEEILTMPIGFELSFPGLLAEAKLLGVDLPYDTPFFQEVEEIRAKKLKRVPLELLHSRPTTLLHTLEGLQTLDIDWERVRQFRGEDGSMCCSPSATAALYMNTGDEKSLEFLERTVQKFNYAVPTCYPLDTFHNLWVVDTLERLGISRYFEAEIEEILEAVYREWSDDEGICWARVLKGVPDLDDTSMAFRLLRQHGYKVSAEGFKGFQKDNAFVCFPIGQMVQGVSDMFNLLRATQTAYPEEKRLAEAESFSRGFLVDALSNNKGDADKWSLKKDMSGEVEYQLRHPEHKSLNRMRVRHYLDKYGPEDVWIGKSIYRLRLVNNTDYLELAKADFNLCQKLHQKELDQILGWVSRSGIAGSSNVHERVVTLFAMFSAEVWEPEFSAVRIAAGKCLVIAMAMHKLFSHQSSLTELRQLVDAVKSWDHTKVADLPESFKMCFMMLYNTVNEATSDSPDQEVLSRQLAEMWEGLLSSFLLAAETRVQDGAGSTDEARKIASTMSGLKAIVMSAIFMSGEVNNPHFVTMIEEDSKLVRIASEAVKLARGIGFEKDALAIPREESQFTVMKKQITKELNWQLGQVSAVPAIAKRILMSFTKIANCYYEDYEQFHYL